MNPSNKEPIFNIRNDTDIIIELHPKEIQLIKALRNNWRFGEVTILVRDGLPYRLKRVQEFIDLDSNC
jgi:hypothetical protein